MQDHCFNFSDIVEKTFVMNSKKAGDFKFEELFFIFYSSAFCQKFAGLKTSTTVADVEFESLRVLG